MPKTAILKACNAMQCNQFGSTVSQGNHTLSEKPLITMDLISGQVFICSPRSTKSATPNVGKSLPSYILEGQPQDVVLLEMNQLRNMEKCVYYSLQTFLSSTRGTLLADFLSNFIPWLIKSSFPSTTACSLKLWKYYGAFRVLKHPGETTCIFNGV